MSSRGALRAVHTNDAQDPMLVTLTRADLAAVVREVIAQALEAFAPKSAPELLTQDELAAALKVSTRSVFTMRQDGCPFLLLGESPRFEFAAVIAWLRARTNSQ
jgi:hypothetical protein